jgi:hypothetical protein
LLAAPAVSIITGMLLLSSHSVQSLVCPAPVPQMAPAPAARANVCMQMDQLKKLLEERVGGQEEATEDAATIDTAPLSGPARVKRALTFWSRVVPILGAYKAVEVGSELAKTLPDAAVAAGKSAGAPLPANEEEAEELYQQLHEWGSERLEVTIKDLKGFYVKTGQVISTRVDLFPEQYTTRLAVCRSGARARD